MKKLFLVLLSLAFCVSGFSQTTLNQLVAGKKIHNCGTSRTAGAIGGTDNAIYRWSKLIATESGATEDNDGISGSTIVANVGVFYDKARIPVYNSTYGLLTVEFGTNELGIAGGNAVPSQFRTALIAFIDHAINVKGWPRTRIIIQSFYWPGCANTDLLPAYNSIFQEVIATYHTLFADYYSRFKEDPNLESYFSSDRLHENILGNRKIADWYKSLDYTDPLGSASSNSPLPKGRNFKLGKIRESIRIDKAYAYAIKSVQNIQN